MGFWRWLFGLETAREREARHLQLTLCQQQKDIEMRSYYTTMVHNAVKTGNEFGYAVECMSAYESVVMAAVKQFTPHNYIVVRDTNEDLEMANKSRFVIHYIIPPSPNHPNPSASLWHQIQIPQTQTQTQTQIQKEHEDPTI